jgi:hypothetical protein
MQMSTDRVKHFFWRKKSENNKTTVFVFQIPLARDGIALDYSKWMYKLLSMIVPEFHIHLEVVDESAVHSVGQTGDKPDVWFSVQVAAKNRLDDRWTVIINDSQVQRSLKCDWPTKSVSKTVNKFTKNFNRFTLTIRFRTFSFHRLH